MTAILQALIERRGVHPVFGDAGEGWGIEQNPAELAVFLTRMNKLGIRTVLEIGTGHRAGLSRFLSQEMNWHVTSIDINDYGHTFDNVTFLRVGDGVPKNAYGLVFIDGDHHYDAVMRDHEMYGRYARTVLAFHDIAGLRDCEGARDYWRQIAYTADGRLAIGCHEIINADNPAGIGWIEL